MNLESLRIFTIVALTGSIQGASNAGAGSRTTVRRKLDELEKVLGVKLVQRKSSGVTLTEAGEVLARRGEQLCYEANTLAQTVREVALNPPRPIRMMVPPGVSPQHHAAAFSMARLAWPDARLELRTGTNLNSVALRHTDVCVTLVQRPPDGAFERFQLPDVALVLLASEAYIETHGPIESVEDLLLHPILAWDPPDQERIMRLPSRRGEGIEFEPSYSTDDIHVLHEMAAAGLGIALVPHPVSELEGKLEFAQVLPELVGTVRPMWLLIADAVADSPRIRRIAELVKDVARSDL